MQNCAVWLLGNQGHLLPKWGSLDSILLRLRKEIENGKTKKSVLVIYHDEQAMEKSLSSLLPKKRKRIQGIKQKKSGNALTFS